MNYILTSILILQCLSTLMVMYVIRLLGRIRSLNTTISEHLGRFPEMTTVTELPIMKLFGSETQFQSEAEEFSKLLRDLIFTGNLTTETPTKTDSSVCTTDEDWKKMVLDSLQ